MEAKAAGVSFDVTQKAHNALRWLIYRQGYRNGEQVFVAWAVSGKSIPDPLKDACYFLRKPVVFKEVVENERVGKAGRSHGRSRRHHLRINSTNISEDIAPN